MEHEIAYEHGTLDVDAIQTELELFWEAYDSDNDLKLEVEKADLSEVRDLSSSERRSLISVDRSGAGFDQTTVDVIVAFAPLAVHIGKGLWDRVVLPWIAKRRGIDAVGKKKQ